MAEAAKKTQEISHNLKEIARLAMITRGLDPDFPPGIEGELDSISGEGEPESNTVVDLTALLWCSIDNDDSQDLDQLTLAEKGEDKQIKIFVAIADVDALVHKGGPIDLRAQQNTTSIYPAGIVFPMLPEKLSSDLTSLVEGKVRLAVVVEMGVNVEGDIIWGKIHRARVKNQAKLAYNSISAWLEGKAPLPEAARRVVGLADQLQLQDRIAQKMRCRRYQHGALELDTIEPRAVMAGEEIIDLKHEEKNRARELIEDFMIAANGATARFLRSAGYPSLRRVVRSPHRWQRIMEVAEDEGWKLPTQPDGKALGEFLSHWRTADPLRFPDISLTIVKLLGRGEYVLELPGESAHGHFGLAVKDYAHSTAPNRRYPDLITQRLVKAALQKAPPPYNTAELEALAVHCTAQEDSADKVERSVRKSAAAILMSRRIGEHFSGIVTGASEVGTWVRIFSPPVEGKVVHGGKGLDVGNKVRVKLISVDIAEGWIDFARTDRH
jgi:exoribonuclease-2